MGKNTSPLSRLLVLVLLLGFGSLTAAVALSQAPGQKPPPKEEEEEPKPKAKPGTEEEDPNYKPKKTKVIRVGDENMSTEPTKNGAAPPDSADLMTAYRAAKVPAVRDFFWLIAEPHDVVSTKGGNVTVGGLPRQGPYRV